MIRSFTGPSKLTPTQAAYVTRAMDDLLPGHRRSGGAHGVDSIVARCADPCKLTLVIPQGHWFNRDLLEIPGVAIEFVSGGYRARNEALVGGSEVLHAFLRSMDFYRSGEWMTVNIARKLHMPVVKHLLPA